MVWIDKICVLIVWRQKTSAWISKQRFDVRFAVLLRWWFLLCVHWRNDLVVIVKRIRYEIHVGQPWRARIMIYPEKKHKISLINDSKIYKDIEFEFSVTAVTLGSKVAVADKAAVLLCLWWKYLSHSVEKELALCFSVCVETIYPTLRRKTWLTLEVSYFIEEFPSLSFALCSAPGVIFQVMHARYVCIYTGKSNQKSLGYGSRYEIISSQRWFITAKSLHKEIGRSKFWETWCTENVT